MKRKSVLASAILAVILMIVVGCATVTVPPDATFDQKMRAGLSDATDAYA